jgi:hypothetical protein
MAELLPFLKFDVEVGAITDLGNRRRMVPISGGSVSGAHAGIILPGGADWQQVMADGTLDIAARYVLKLDDGLVEVDSRGLRHASPEVLARLDRGEQVDKGEYYFRTAIRLFSSSPALAYLNHLLCISIGERRARSVHLDVRRLT